MLATLSFLLVSAPRPLVLAHYMPWYAAPPVSSDWGWHWTMNHFKPGQMTNGRPDIASHYTPLIGPYDSGDPDVLECQTLQMKIAGIDGVIIDWYGRDDVYDYAMVHRNTLRLSDAVTKAGLKFAICYEDQSIPNLVKFGKVAAGAEVEYGQKVLEWCRQGWFKAPNYVRLDGKPVLLVFGPQFYKPADWKKVVGKADVATLGVMGDHDGMTGGFGWPSPKASEEESQREITGFYDRAKAWKAFIGIAYPRFHDIYAEAGVHASYGRIGDADGATFRKTLALARSKNSPIIQIATWNDYGEGTIIEPTKEFGYRDLEVLRGDAIRKSALRLPARLFALRKRGVSEKVANPIVAALLGGKYDSARRQLELAENG
jgi:hypothetical protein